MTLRGLSVSCYPASPNEETDFIIKVTTDGEVVPEATVTFAGVNYTTDSAGSVKNVAPVAGIPSWVWGIVAPLIIIIIIIAVVAAVKLKKAKPQRKNPKGIKSNRNLTLTNAKLCTVNWTSEKN